MTSQTARRPVWRVDAACPLRLGQPCNLCHPEAHLGPQDCPTVALVMEDDLLRAELVRRRSAEANGSA
ncbi:MAG: DUF6767 domain-containing protein [Actinomycetes bacterium]